MTLDEANAMLGRPEDQRRVEYQPAAGPAEQGVLVGAGDRFAWVRYDGSRHAAATRPEDLTAVGVLFGPDGRYRLTPAQRTCVTCHRVLVDEDELGLYYQTPAQENVGPLEPGGPDTVLTFNYRVHECDGGPHVLPAP